MGYFLPGSAKLEPLSFPRAAEVSLAMFSPQIIEMEIQSKSSGVLAAAIVRSAAERFAIQHVVKADESDFRTGEELRGTKEGTQPAGRLRAVIVELAVPVEPVRTVRPFRMRRAFGKEPEIVAVLLGRQPAGEVRIHAQPVMFGIAGGVFHPYDELPV